MSIALLINVQIACLMAFVTLWRKRRAENHRRLFLDRLEKALLEAAG